MAGVGRGVLSQPEETPPAEEVRRLVDWSRAGPRLAVVSDVAVQPEPPEGLAAFRIR